MKLLVYGTLKKGYGLHRIIEDCTYLGVNIVDNHRLISLGHCPGLVPSEGDSTVGEVYEINDTALLNRLDEIEGAYNRTKFGDFEAYVLKPLYRHFNHGMKNIKVVDRTYEWI